MAKRKVVLILDLKEGAENELLVEMKSNFPSEALREIDGLEEITICQGNDQFAAVVEYDGDFEKIFSGCIANAALRQFYHRVSRHFDNLPQSTRPADLPLVGDVLYWDGRKVREAAG